VSVARELSGRDWERVGVIERVTKVWCEISGRPPKPSGELAPKSGQNQHVPELSRTLQGTSKLRYFWGIKL
jgi:hypothetical protein